MSQCSVLWAKNNHDRQLQTIKIPIFILWDRISKIKSWSRMRKTQKNYTTKCIWGFRMEGEKLRERINSSASRHDCWENIIVSEKQIKRRLNVLLHRASFHFQRETVISCYKCGKSKFNIYFKLGLIFYVSCQRFHLESCWLFKDHWTKWEELNQF